MYGQRYMVSPCGNGADWFEPSDAPEGWTDCTEMTDAAVGDLMMRRMMASVEMA